MAETLWYASNHLESWKSNFNKNFLIFSNKTEIRKNRWASNVLFFNLIFLIQSSREVKAVLPRNALKREAYAHLLTAGYFDEKERKERKAHDTTLFTGEAYWRVRYSWIQERAAVRLTY